MPHDEKKRIRKLGSEETAVIQTNAAIVFNQICINNLLRKITNFDICATFFVHIPVLPLWESVCLHVFEWQQLMSGIAGTFSESVTRRNYQ